jgi:hypothetical protein
MSWATVNTLDENKAKQSAYRVGVKRWANDTEADIIQLFGTLDVGVTDMALSSLFNQVTTKGGEPIRVAYKFERYLIFVAKGVGGVYAINPKGSGRVTRRTPGAINRTPKNIFEPITTNLNTLANLSAGYFADQAQLTSSVIIRN